MDKKQRHLSSGHGKSEEEDVEFLRITLDDPPAHHQQSASLGAAQTERAIARDSRSLD